MITSRTKLTALTFALSLVTSFGFTSIVNAAPEAHSGSGDTQRVQGIITSGDNKIAARLNSLNEAATKLSSMEHLTAADKATLQSNIDTAINNLNAQKAKLDADTTVAAATADRNAIMTDFRIYAVVLPQIRLVRLADDQLATEAKLTTFASKLSPKVTGNSALQTKLTDMQSKISAAQALTTAAEAKILAVSPSDYNTNHDVLKQEFASLKQAHSDNQAAYQDGRSILSSLK